MGEEIPTTSDRFLGGRVSVRQPARGYRAGVDPVFLAAAVAAKPGERVLDLGCGTGTAGLCLLARVPDISVVGLELQPALAELARANAEANGLGERMIVVEGSLLAPPPSFRQAFDHVMTNPPWYQPGRLRQPEAETKRVGHVEGEIDLAAWIKAASGLLRPKGRLAVIHRADRLADLLAALGRCGLGGVRVFPLWPKPGKAAVRVVVTARRAARTPLELLPGLVLHHADGRYTAEAVAVLRDAAALERTLD